MTDRTVNNLPAATHGESVRCLFAIELSTKSAGYRIQYATVREDQPPHLDWMQMEGAT